MPSLLSALNLWSSWLLSSLCSSLQQKGLSTPKMLFLQSLLIVQFHTGYFSFSPSSFMYLCLPPCFCFFLHSPFLKHIQAYTNPCCVAVNSHSFLDRHFCSYSVQLVFSLLRCLSCFTCRRPASLFSHKASCLLLFHLCWCYCLAWLIWGNGDTSEHTLMRRLSWGFSLSLHSVAEADLTFLSLPSKLELKVCCSALHSFLILVSISPSPSLLSFPSSFPPSLPSFLFFLSLSSSLHPLSLLPSQPLSFIFSVCLSETGCLVT